MTTTTPTRSVDQRRAALLLANEVRTARARLKKQIKAAPSIAPLILRYPNVYPHAPGMRVETLLKAVPYVGVTRSESILKRTRTSRRKTLENLTERQRSALAAELEHRP